MNLWNINYSYELKIGSLKQWWLFGGISPSHEKNPHPPKNPGDKNPQKTPNPRDKNPQIFKNPQSPGIKISGF